MLMMNTLTEDKEIKIMADIENIGINEYLKKIGFDEEEIEEILEYANSEIDRKVAQIIKDVVVLPCAPATQIAFFSSISFASICERCNTGNPNSFTRIYSSFVSRIAVERTT